jgi:Tol biopolymer transport system component
LDEFQQLLRRSAAGQQLTPDGFDEDWPAWSPEENLLGYGGKPHVNEEERPVYDIFLMDVRMKQTKQITADLLSEQAPVFVQVARE